MDAASTALVIEDVPVPPNDLWRYAVRWLLANDGAAPVLYRDGRRVTRAWRLEMSAAAVADAAGASANTD